MSSSTLPVNIRNMMAMFNLEIKMLPDHLKCSVCKSILKDACQLPCGCRFCRACIDDVIVSGGQFCTGGSQECGSTPLSTALTDYVANKSILRLTAKCPLPGCSHEFQLSDIENHLRVCPRNSVHCPFREFGCQQKELAAEEMSGHLLQESRSHRDILIGMVANINKDVEMLKRRDEASRNDTEMLTCDQVQKDEQIKMLVEEMRHVQNEIKSIKLEKEVLSDRVRELSEKLKTEQVKNDIRSINQNIQSINANINSVKSELQSTRMAVGLERVDASYYDWLIDDDIERIGWGWDNRKTSNIFTGSVHHYNYRLTAVNNVSSGELLVYLLIHAGPVDSSLKWPFNGAITVTVADRDKREARNILTQRCQIHRSHGNNFKCSDRFVFPHSDLDDDELDIDSGVLVSCEIVPGDGH